MTGQIIRPFGPTIYKGKFSDRLRLEVIERSLNSKDSASEHLAGNIEHEQFIDLSQECGQELTSKVQDFLEQCHRVGVYKPPAPLKSITYEKIWVNHQKKGEWNPPHVHSGDFSMVGYCQVPEELKNEWEFENQKGQDPVGGKIQWNYGTTALHNTTVFGPIVPEEGVLYIFPAWLLHFVFPFNSDVTRISFSTNCHLVY